MGKVAIHARDDVDMAEFKNIYNAHEHGANDPVRIDRYASFIFWFDPSGQLNEDPGTSYVARTTAEQKPVVLTDIAEARVVVTAEGNEADSGKGIEIYNSTDAVQLCEVTWDGTSRQDGLAGSWTAVAISGEKTLIPRYKGSTATEDLTTYWVELQVR